MPPESSVVTTASSMSSSSESDISLPSSPSPSPEPSSDPYALSSSEDEVAPPPKRKSRWLCTVERQRNWPTADEVVLLEAAAAHKEQHGRVPRPADLPSALGGRLPHVSADEAAQRLHVLRSRYDDSVRRLRRGTVPVTDGDVRVFRLSKRIWEGAPPRKQRRPRRPRPAPHHERRGFEELRGMYPCLASVVEEIESGGGTGLMLMRAFGRMGDAQAAALEAKVKRQRLAELKTDVRRAELRSAVAGALLDVMDTE